MLCLFGWPSSAQNGVTGLGPNLLVNSGFEQLATNGKPVAWYDNGFYVDNTVKRSGAVSFRLRDANTIPYAQSAGTELNLTKGTYFIGGWVKTDRLAATQGAGVRICLRAPPSYPWTIAVGCTAIVKGTADWQYLSKSGIVVGQDTKAAVVLEAYAEPDGTAWFDDIELRPMITDTTPPAIGGVAVGNVTGTSAAITWRTDEPADRQVEYGTTTSYGSQTPVDGSLSTSHQVTLSGLRPATTYHFRVKSRDAAGNLAVSADQVFTTLDTIPPVISALVAASVTATGATITWVTDEPADTQLDYGTTTAYGSQSPLDSRLVTVHSVTLSGLLPGTTYHCRARSRDAAGNLAISADLVFQTAAVAPTALTKVGGLTAYPQGQLSPNLLVNGGFETAGSNGKPLGWSDNGFLMDTSVAHTGNASYRLTDANLIPYSQAASQQLSMKKGVYQFSVWVKLSNLAAAQGSGVRVCFSAPPSYPWQLVRTCTPTVKGTSDWQKLTLTKIVLPEDSTASLSLEAYGEPDGTAWFDDAELRRESLPLNVFMLYPNYRGLLFDDQSQTARFHVSVDPPAGTALSSYQVVATVTDELTGQVLHQASYAAQATFVAQFDMAGLANDRSYLLQFRLLSSTGAGVFDYPAHRIVKVSGALRQQMAVSFDQ
ncbi:MAG: fibronectin type III domain-containing protein, partial [Bryobacteraceae bacterium]